MTPNQLPPLPEPDTHCFDDDTGKDVWSYTADQMHAYALAALAQQAQEPVAAALGDIVARWDQYAPSEYMTAIHMQAKRALAGQQPVSPDMHRWCAYVGGMVASWVTSEPDAHARLGDDKFEAAIAGIIERRLWAMPKRDTTPPAPQPAVPVVSDGVKREQINALLNDDSQDSKEMHDFARAILALRPQPVPMTDERLAEVLTTAYGSPEWTMDDVRAARAVEAAVKEAE